MALFEISSGNALYYEHTAPARQGAQTFVFVNALTGNTQAWEAQVAPALREQGFGTLSYNFRGQDQSPFAGVELTPDLIIEDLRALLGALQPERPVLVGLSIGGLFAAHAVLKGAKAEALVLLNTLREIGPRIAWVNDALPHLVARGGVRLFMDAMFPLLVNGDMAAEKRADFISDAPYEPLDPDHGHMNLMRNSVSADWDIPYEDLALPVLVVTGLQDRVFLDTDVVERLAARLPKAARMDWPDAGHLLPQERPEKLIHALAAFSIGLRV